MIYLLFSLLLIISFLCGISEGITDILNFRYNESIFKKYNPKFWNKDISFNNKNVKGNLIKKLFYKTVGVFITDGWHLFKSLHTLLLFCMIIISYIIFTNNLIFFIIVILTSYTFKKLIFEIAYNRFFIIKQFKNK